MPRLVDHARRREELAEALWRIVRREGLACVSVRRVAEEAGVSTGSLRHYFTTQSELLAFSMRLVIDRVRERLGRLDWNAESRTLAERVACELLPLDEERTAEAEVWLAFSGQALVDPALRALRQETDAVLSELWRRLAGALVDASPAEIDVAVEAARLHALIDGLAVHALVRPEGATPQHLRRVVSYHLDGVCDARREPRQRTVRPEGAATR